MDLVIEARAFVRGALSDVEIGIDQSSGTIEAVKRNLAGRPRRRFPGQLLLPSGVDWHVHFRDPGFPHKEDFHTGTLGAALGGVGTVLDMPNTRPQVDRISRLEEKIEGVRGKACVDWGLWATLTPPSPKPLELLRRCAGLKMFLAPTTGVDAPPTNPEIRRALQFARQAGRWTVVHAENPPAKRASHSTRDHDAARPLGDEVAAIERLASLAPDPARVHIAHVTSRPAAQAAARAGFSCGATPHHLLLSYESIPDAFGKVNPPLRDPAIREGLVASFQEGNPTHLESDHAPHTADEKRGRFDEAPAGVPGIQTMLPLLLHRAKKGELAIERVVSAASERPAQDLGIPTGRIEHGLQADFILINPRDPRRIRGERLASRCRWTPFEGMEAIFPTTHYLRGEPIVEDGEFVGRVGRGRQIAVAPASDSRPPVHRVTTKAKNPRAD